MNPGRMDRQIQLQRATTAQNGIGEAVKTWATYATVPAQIKVQPAGERVNGDKREGDNKAMFTIRYIAGVLTSDRLLYEAVNYDILNVREVGRRHLLEVEARRQV